MRKIYHVKLFGEERGYLEELLRAGKAAARTLMHARILLKADEGPGGPAWSDDQIVDALEVSLWDGKTSGSQRSAILRTCWNFFGCCSRASWLGYARTTISCSRICSCGISSRC